MEDNPTQSNQYHNTPNSSLTKNRLSFGSRHNNIHNAINSLNNITQNTNKRRTQTPRRGSRKQILVFIPLGIPGMGKSTFVATATKLLKERRVDSTIIDSDEIRGELIQELKARKPAITHQCAFEETCECEDQRFLERIQETMQKISSLPESAHAIFIDKNFHGADWIKGLIQFLCQPRFKEDFIVKVFVVKPSCVGGFKSKGHSYPFSLSLLVKCLRRVLARRNHQTLVGSKMKMYTVTVAFYKFYRDLELTESKLKEIGTNSVIEIPFTDEDAEKEKEIAERLGDKLEGVLEDIEDFSVDEEKMSRFVKEMEKLEVELGDPDPEVFRSKLEESVEKCMEMVRESR